VVGRLLVGGRSHTGPVGCGAPFVWFAACVRCARRALPVWYPSGRGRGDARPRPHHAPDARRESVRATAAA